MPEAEAKRLTKLAEWENERAGPLILGLSVFVIKAF
jgi:hypothetical protein